jgi:hypothetical protein
MDKLPARAGWHWIKQGWMLFRKQPGALMALFFACMFASMFVLLVPVLGQILWCVLMPLFSIALLQGCAEIDQGRRALPNLLLAGFQKPMRKQLLGLGALNFLLMALAMLVIYAMAGDALDVVREAQTPGAVKPENVEGLLGGVLTGSAIYTAGWMLTSMAAPLIFWQKMALNKAVFFSVVAVLRAIKAFVSALLIQHVLYFIGVQIIVLILGVSQIGIAAIFTLFLITLVLVHCTLYAAYCQLFGPPQTPAPAAVDLNKPQ